MKALRIALRRAGRLGTSGTPRTARGTVRSGLRAYLTIAFLARLADEGVAVAVVSLALHRTGSAAQGAFVLMAWMAPHVLAAPAAGAVAARTGSARLLYGCGLAGFGTAIAALAATVGRAPAPVVFAVAVAGGCFGPLVTGALSSLLGALIPAGGARDRAYALDAAVYNAASVAGPGAAAALTVVASPAPALLLLAAAALGAAALTAALPRGARSVGTRPTRPPGDVREGPARSVSEPRRGVDPLPGPRPAAPTGACAPGTPAPDRPGPPPRASAAPPTGSPTTPDSPEPSEPAQHRAPTRPVPPPRASLALASAPTGSRPARSQCRGSRWTGPAAATPAAGTAAPPPRAARGAFGRALPGFLSDGPAAVWRTPELRAVTSATSLAFVGVGGLTTTAVLLGHGGALMTAFAVGALAGSLAVARWPPRVRVARQAEAGLLGLGLSLAAAAVAAAARSPVLCPPLFAVAGLCDGVVLTATLRIRSDFAPPGTRPQVFTLGAGLKITAAAAGAGLAGLLAARPAPLLLLGIAALQLAAALLHTFLSPAPDRAGRRRARTRTGR
ncbi:MFS transporter [Streptomyces wuyuanensis]|uniref:MFS transporter n=1 Tax=Streptomyces wuyuanensis TaxID=1196353 RepID=UPI003720CB68